MLSDTQKLHKSFKTLSALERRLLALKSICHEYDQFNYRQGFISTLIKSGITDENGKKLTAIKYKDSIKHLKQLGLSKSSSELDVPEELRHEILILMSEEEMAWVFTLVTVFYGQRIASLDNMQNQHSYYYENTSQILALLTKAIYANESQYFSMQQNNPLYYMKLMDYLAEIIGDTPINLAWLQSRNKVIRGFIYLILLRNYYCGAAPMSNSTEVLALFNQQNVEDMEHDSLNYYSAIIHLSLGNTAKASAHCANIKDKKSGYSLAVEASIALLTGQSEVATSLYRKALPALRKQYGRSTYYFDTILGIFHSICLAYADNDLMQIPKNVTQYLKYSKNNSTLSMDTIYEVLSLVSLVEQGQQKEVKKFLTTFNKDLDEESCHPLTLAFYHLLSYMIDKENYLSRNLNTLHTQAQQYLKTQHFLAAHLFYELLNQTKEYEVEASAFFQHSAIKWRLLDLIKIKESWEYSVQALEDLLLENNNTPTLTKTKRLLWLVNPDKQLVDVAEQSLTKSGSWSPGKAISLTKLKHFHQYEELDYLSAEDKRVSTCLIDAYEVWNNAYEFDTSRALLALVGHQNIAHHQNRSVAIELVHGEPELYIEENKKGYKLSLSHWSKKAGVVIEAESLNKYRVIEFSTAFVSIGLILSKSGLSIPAVAKDKLVHIIQNAKRDIKIHVGIKDITIPELAGDPTPCIQLLPIKAGIKANLWVRPLANQGTYCKPGLGKAHVMMLLTENGNETRTRIVRDLTSEKSNKDALLSQCPNLSHHEYEPGEYETENPEDTLEILSELQRYARAHPLIIEWPQGQTFKIKQQVFAQGLSLKISSATNWFEYTGEITLNDGEVMSMQALLESLDSKSYGRFVRLENGEFIELSSQLRRQLSLLHAISDGNKINPLGAQILSDIAAEAENISFDEGWETHVQKMKTMKNHKPKLPSTLHASLRDYQLEGFHYLSRLTHWGIGACLADDMGLGKTIQTIALLLERAKKGASLVIAPTSVCFNWIEELNKFAPTLKVHNLRTDERATLINNAAKFDVVICSYGLLQHNAELLTAKQWETIVLDEAQAIKNANTQRWKTVMKLKGKNRIALSGTPIENHLGELWSIFSFINPGLLGSIKSFQNKYSTPIEMHQAPEKIQALKALVSPYILRRLKSEVLSELPPKTEQIIHVEQTKEEAAFYEALRRKAEERMKDLVEENNRIAVLAEITKLRQACCDCSLVDSSLSIENSKLNAFIETVKNIIDNGHKALVFSQYVSFLDIVRKRIEQEKIVYQYLDGSTSPAKRKKSVEAFQAGDGDLFLLSLKAGGSGLNLTAADYVIHLDPWWNPAVEDQASDRAHRIGQERPVTIYRFIMQNTIEEKIINLHQQKRNLANDLLSGQGVSGKLSNNDLLELIVAGGLSNETLLA